MRPGIIIIVTTADRARLEAVVADRNSPQKYVWRAAILLGTANGLGTNAVMRVTGKNKNAVWRRQERSAGDGVDGLFRDKTRPSRIAPFGQDLPVLPGRAEHPQEPAALADFMIPSALGARGRLRWNSGRFSGCRNLWSG
jgi:hypothetical protein